jgi:hypothetical protein
MNEGAEGLRSSVAKACLKMVKSRNSYRLIVMIAAALLSSCGSAADRETANANIVEQGERLEAIGERLETMLSVIANHNTTLATIPEEAGCYKIFVKWSAKQKDSYLLNECTGQTSVMVGDKLKPITGGPYLSITSALALSSRNEIFPLEAPEPEPRIYQIIASGFNDTSTYLLNTETGATWNLTVDRSSSISGGIYTWAAVAKSTYMPGETEVAPE